MTPRISPEEFEKAMKKIQTDPEEDCEMIHVRMDELMSNVLRKLGYSKGIDVFEDTPKWYA